MPRIHDWSRLYWINAKGEREYNPEGLDVPEETLSIYQNERGEQVGIQYAPDDADHKYEVTLNGEVVEDITLTGENFDGEEFERLVFDTRGDAREAGSDLMRMLPAIDEDMLVEPDEEDGVEGYTREELIDRAVPRGIPGNLKSEELREQLRAV